MIHVTYCRDTRRAACLLKVEGHAGYAEKGSDIVCAAASVLAQTLLHQLEGRDSAESVQNSGPKGPCITVVLEDEDPEAWDAMDFARVGLELLAEDYPDYVRFEDRTGKRAELELDLQLFAEGGEGGSTAAEGTSEEAAAPEMPKLRPAEERLARRSGVLKSSPAAKPAPEAEKGPEEEPGPAAEETTPDSDPAAGASETKDPDETRAEHRRAFGKLMQGEYQEEFAEAMQRAVEAASRQMRQDPALTGLLEALANAYGTDAGDLNALTEAVKNGRVKDEAYYEKLAMEKGISVKTAREMDKLESQNRKLSAAQQLAEEQRKAAQRQAEMEAIHAEWDREAEALKAAYPDFDLQQTLENPEIGDLMRRGVSLSNAYRAVYFDQLMASATERTAKQVEQGVEARIRQRSSRPGENGTRPGGAVQTRLDVNNMTRKEREALERRVMRGEKITFLT